MCKAQGRLRISLLTRHPYGQITAIKQSLNIRIISFYISFLKNQEISTQNPRLDQSIISGQLSTQKENTVPV